MQQNVNLGHFSTIQSLQNLTQPQKKLLAADITLWRPLKELYFNKATAGSKYYFDLLKDDCCDC